MTETFPARIEREQRCAIGIVDLDRTTGLVRQVGMRGRATVEPFDAPLARRLLARYVGPDERAWDRRFRTTLTSSRDEQGLLLRFEPETVVARDVSYVP
jgi:hypothetical protein